MILLAGACSSGGGGTPAEQERRLICTAVMPDMWQSPSPDLRFQKIARELDVEEAQVRHGLSGFADCDQAVDKRQVDAGIHAAVDGIAPDCLAVGFLISRAAEQPDTGNRVLLVCPASDA